jgi:hypothetical protein
MRQPLSPAPSAPGSLTQPAGSGAVLSYLDQLRRWRDELKNVLARLDQLASAASNPGAFVSDLTLAMTLSESIDRRTDELISAWDSGRVGPVELAKIAQLMWGRLPDALGNPSAFSLSEASSLASALQSSLSARLDADSIAGSGAADRIGPLRETLQRCEVLSATLGRRGGESVTLAAALDTALSGDLSPQPLGAEINRIADAAEVLERDLIKETALRSAVQGAAAALAARLMQLSELEQVVRSTAEQCRDKIAAAPRLAVPDVAVLGAVPSIPDGAQEPGSWHAARAALDAFRARVDLVAATLAEAQRRFRAPLEERAELRGLADAYRVKAGAAGLAEDGALTESYAALRAVLWNAPCDLVAARPLVAAYVAAIQKRLSTAKTSAEGAR